MLWCPEVVMYAFTWLMLLSPACAQEAPKQPSPPIDWASLDLRALDGSALDSALVAGKVVLVVNVASKCGFTTQYEGLQTLHDAHGSRGFTVLGVPCNQFLGQEPGTPEEIASFCKQRYGVTFPLLEKQSVNGAHRTPLYRKLVDSEVGGGRNIKWNFTKFLVGADGVVIGRYGSTTSPDDPAVAADIRRALDPVRKP